MLQVAASLPRYHETLLQLAASIPCDHETFLQVAGSIPCDHETLLQVAAAFHACMGGLPRKCNRTLGVWERTRADVGTFLKMD